MFKPRKPGGAEPRDNPLAKRVLRGDDSPTQALTTADEPATRHMSGPVEAATRLLGTAAIETPVQQDLPAGALMIITGPGLGALLPVGYGVNRVGRGADQRIRLDYGDQRISRADHARLTYDGEGQRFYLQHGAGSSLVYHNGEPVLQPIELHDGARIKLGDTQLLFRVLLGPDFNWQD